MSKNERIERMLTLAGRLDAIVAEMKIRKEIILRDKYKKAA